MTQYYVIEIMPPKNGRPGAVAVSTKFGERQVVAVDLGDSEDTIGGKIALILRKFERGA